jgi:hypothetical protein
MPKTGNMEDDIVFIKIPDDLVEKLEPGHYTITLDSGYIGIDKTKREDFPKGES